MSETLEQQAVQAGIDLGYHDINGTYHVTKTEVLESIVAVLDKSKPDSDGLYLNTMVAHENGEESLQMPSEFHGAEAVEDALVHVLAQVHAHALARGQGIHDDEPRDDRGQVGLDVAGNGASEELAEQDGEHHRLDEDVVELPGVAHHGDE